jgi:hypothetical protein
MSETDQEKREDEVLRRMLATKPRPHKDEQPKGTTKGAKRKSGNGQ